MASLPGAGRVPKSHPRVEACGDLDELCSVMGALAASLAEDLSQVQEEIHRIQGSLLAIGARVASGKEPASPAAATFPLMDLETAIDRMEAALSPQKGFILPGGHPSAAWAHVARTVCRRAERHMSALGAGALVEGILPYLNRLSTYLFDLARWCNKEHGVAESEWGG